MPFFILYAEGKANRRSETQGLTSGQENRRGEIQKLISEADFRQNQRGGEIMQYGHFDNEAREYVIDRVDLPASWTNYIGTKDMLRRRTCEKLLLTFPAGLRENN